VLAGLWSGEPFSLDGEHHRVRGATFLPPPVQRPRIPIWVAGWWPHRRPMRRAARWDGAFPGTWTGTGMGRFTPDEVREIAAYIAAHRTADTPFDLVIAGTTPGDDPTGAARLLAPYAEAGVTWWVESFGEAATSLDGVRQRIQQGPPRPEGSA
jgi:alkanesulfonate monooxygenase SsuD/methylene tetrahydromethanopterin reductase-like flavin-dependent oxidoreductase (luciferase family)